MIKKNKKEDEKSVKNESKIKDKNSLKTINFRKKKKKSIMHKHKTLTRYFDRAGVKQESIFFKIFFVCLFIIIIFDLIFLYFNYGIYETRYILAMFIVSFTFGMLVLYILSLILLYTYLDFKIFFRTKQIEEHLPEFFFLTSSNLRAGMLVDQAMINAIRPKFGALSEEMEHVMKEVMSGKHLSDSLKNFSDKYESIILSRSMEIVISGIESGASISGTLNKIAINLSDLSLQKKEMGASVTTYVIFIVFASIFIAPVLLALAGSILEVVKGLISNLAQSDFTSASSISFISFSVPELTQSDYLIFAIFMLIVLSFFSAIIVSLIRKGNVHQGFKLVPIFILVSLLVFFISYNVLFLLFGGMFTF